MAVQFEKTIRTLLDEKKYQTLKDILVTMEPADIAAVFEDLEEERMPLLFRLLPKETAAETFAELDSEWQELLIRGFSDRELHELVNELYVDLRRHDDDDLALQGSPRRHRGDDSLRERPGRHRQGGSRCRLALDAGESRQGHRKRLIRRPAPPRRAGPGRPRASCAHATRRSACRHWPRA